MHFGEGTSKVNNSLGQDEEFVVGFDDEAMALLERLTGFQQKLEVISIVGMPGLGKTTLARKLYEDPAIVYHFHIRAWATVSQSYMKRDLLIGILSCLMKLPDDVHELNDAKLSMMLRQSLMGKRYLIIMDDIWDIGAWNDLMGCFPDDNNGSRILFTSRLIDVALQAQPNSCPHRLRFLTECESWDLLRQKVFQNGICPPELISSGKEIIRKCQGLPLALLVIAGLLANEKTSEWWSKVAVNLSSYIVSDPKQYLGTLALSYVHLPDHLKACFLYLGVFPGGYEIPVQKLIWLWIAEGFIYQIGRKSLEDTAEDYLKDLINRSL